MDRNKTQTTDTDMISQTRRKKAIIMMQLQPRMATGLQTTRT